MTEGSNREPLHDLLATADLLSRAKSGERNAMEFLIARYRPRLERWASGRLPPYARSLFDTGDLIQETLLRTVENLAGIEIRNPGSFEAYARRAIMNRIRDQVRWARRRVPADLELVTDRGPSPLESAIGADVIEQYEAAMGDLSDEDQMLIHLRVDLAMDYPEIAVATGRASSDAARMAARRALARLAARMAARDRRFPTTHS